MRIFQWLMDSLRRHRARRSHTSHGNQHAEEEPQTQFIPPPPKAFPTQPQPVPQAMPRVQELNSGRNERQEPVSQPMPREQELDSGRSERQAPDSQTKSREQGLNSGSNEQSGRPGVHEAAMSSTFGAMNPDEGPSPNFVHENSNIWGQQYLAKALLQMKDAEFMKLKVAEGISPR